MKKLLLWFVILAACPGIAAGSAEALTITFIDVGHGDAILLEFPCSKTMLIDAGDMVHTRFNAARDVILPLLEAKRISRLDWLVLTHPHSDHIGGAPHLLKTIPVETILLCGTAYTSQLQRDLFSIIDEKGIPVLFPVRGETLPLCEEITITVLNPPKRRYRYTRSDANNNSLVLLFQYRAFTFLATGDAELESLEDIHKAYPYLQAEILKVPHHGSRSSFVPHFWDTLGITAAVVCVEEDPVGSASRYFGLPHQEVLDYFTSKRIRLLRTDTHGRITITTDGHTWTHKTTKTP